MSCIVKGGELVTVKSVRAAGRKVQDNEDKRDQQENVGVVAGPWGSRLLDIFSKHLRLHTHGRI
jgi:hypothetical protein